MSTTRSADNFGLPGLITRDHIFTAPLDHLNPGDGRTISVFAREVVLRKRDKDKLPWMVYFTGGPGFGAVRPVESSGWLKRLLQDYRVLLLDERGTGRSTPVGLHTLAVIPDPKKQAEYLTHFRADSIARDAELIRRKFLGDEPWFACGQSYGGWCITAYLSIAPQGLSGALLTGGLPPILRRAEDVYRETYKIQEKRCENHYQRFPQDEQKVRQIVDILGAKPVTLPQGDLLTVRRFQQVGFNLFRGAGYAQVHNLLDDAIVEGPGGPELSYKFLRGFEQNFSFETNPIFAVLHEAIYAQGESTRWAAERMRREYPQYDASRPGRVLLTGEMIYPWMFEDYKALRPFREVAELLAEYDRWPRLYDLEAYARNPVPVAAVIYYSDACVVRQWSEEAARAIRNTRVWVTNEYEHDGVGVDGEKIIGRLIEMMSGDVAYNF